MQFGIKMILISNIHNKNSVLHNFCLSNFSVLFSEVSLKISWKSTEKLITPAKIVQNTALFYMDCNMRKNNTYDTVTSNSRLKEYKFWFVKSRIPTSDGYHIKSSFCLYVNYNNSKFRYNVLNYSYRLSMMK